MSASPVVVFLAVIFTAQLVLGVALLATGVRRQVRTRGWIRTTGELVWPERPRGVRRRYHYRWRDRNGHAHDLWSAMTPGARAMPRMLSAGGPRRPRPIPVPMRYDPRAPHRAILDTLSGRGVGNTVAGCAALGFGLLMGAYVLALFRNGQLP